MELIREKIWKGQLWIINKEENLWLSVGRRHRALPIKQTMSNSWMQAYSSGKSSRVPSLVLWDVIWLILNCSDHDLQYVLLKIGHFFSVNSRWVYRRYINSCNFTFLTQLQVVVDLKWVAYRPFEVTTDPNKATYNMIWSSDGQPHLAVTWLYFGCSASIHGCL